MITVDDCIRTGNQDGGHKPVAGMNSLRLGFHTRYQWESRYQTGIFVVEEHNGTDVNTVQCQRESQIKNGSLKPELKTKQRNI